MADPKDTKLQQSQLKEIETLLASVEQRMQRLAILNKSIELKLIDPKDSQRFDLFIKQLAKVDTSNIESLRGYITGANEQFDELIYNNKQFSKQSEATLKIYNNTNTQIAGIVSKFNSASKSTSKLNSNLEKTNELVDSFVEGFQEGLDELLDIDKVQLSIESGMRKISKSQKDQIKNAFGLNSNYDQVSANILDIGKQLEGSNTRVSNMLQFDIGKIDKFGETLDQALSNIGADTINIDGEEISSELRESFLRGLTGGGDVLAKNMGDRIEATKKIIQKKSKETQEVIDAMIADLEAKSMDPDAQILSPEMQGKVEAAWGRIQKKGNAALMDMIVNTSKAGVKLKQFNERIAEGKDAVVGIEKLQKQFEGVGRAADSILDSLQHTTRSVMPNWLYQTLGLDDAFTNITNTANEGLKQVATNISLGQSPMQAMSGFAGSFSSSLLKSVGVIGLITIGVTALWKMMTSAGESVKQLSTEFGVSRATAHGMYKDILNITAAVDNTSLKQEDVLAVLKKHRDEYGVIMDLNNAASQEAVKFAGQLGKQYGIGADAAYGFTQQLQQLGADQAASQEIAAVAAHASDLAGIPFSTITKDLAESSEFVATQFAGYPLKAVAAAAKIRAMGSSLKQVEKAMDKAFNVSTFMKDMTELNIMTHGVVDLSKMFEFSISGDEEGVAREIGKQYDKMVAAGQMNQFQMRKFAEATGVSVQDLQKGAELRKLQADLGEDVVDSLSKHLDQLSAEDVANAKNALAAKKKLDASEKLNTIWASLQDTLTQALLPVLEGISSIISGLAPALKLAGAVIKGIVAPFTMIFELVSSIFNLFTFRTKEAGDNIKSFGDIFMSTVGNWSSPLNAIGSILALIVGLWTGSKLIGSIGKIGTMIKGMSTSTLGMFNSLKGMVTGPLSTVSSMASSVMAPGGMLSGMLPGGGMMSGMMGKAGDVAKNVMGKVGGAGNLMKIGGGITAGALGGVSAYKKQKEKGGTDSEAAGAAMIQGGLAASGAVLGTALGGPLGGMIGGFLGDTVGGWLVDNAPGLVKKAGEMWDKLSAKFAKLAETWQPIIEKVFGIISSIFEKAADIWSAIFSKIGDAISWLIDGLDSFANMLGFDGLAGMLGDVLLYPLNLILTGLGNLVDMFTMVGQLLTGDFTGAWDSFTGMIGNSLDALIPDWIWSSDDSKESEKNPESAAMLKESIAQTDKLDSLQKASESTVEQLKAANDLATAANNSLKGLNDGEKKQLKEAGYSDDIIKKLDAGSLSIEGAMKENRKNLSSGSPSLAKGTNLVKSDGMAILHKGEAVVPADVVNGGFNLPGGSIPIPLPVKIVNDETSVDNKGLFQKVFGKMIGSNEISETLATTPTQTALTPRVSKPTSNTVPALETPVSQATVQASNYNTPPASMKSVNSQDATLKQLMTIMQDVANRPVVVQIGGIELRSLNNKLKVYNNK